jgi:hypothetical protein
MAACSPIAVRTITSEKKARYEQKVVEGNFLGVAKLTGILLLGGEELLNLLTNLSIRNFDIILGLSIIGHQGEESVVRDIELKTNMSVEISTHSS